MRVGISGSRSITDQDWVDSNLDSILNGLRDRSPNGIVLLVGGAKGADSCVASYAKERSIDTVLFKPYHMVDNKAPYNARYFFSRNKQIVDNSDFVIILWDGKSRGTGWTLEYAEQVKKDRMARFVYQRPYGLPE